MAAPCAVDSLAMIDRIHGSIMASVLRLFAPLL